MLMGFHPVNMGKLLIGEPDKIACTPLWNNEAARNSQIEDCRKNLL